MNVYRVTFTAADGSIIDAEIITAVTLPTDFWTLKPAGNGTEYSAFPAGNPNPPFWSNIPNFLNQTASLSINILTTYITPTSGVSCQLNGTLPTGWAFDGTHLTYNGTSINANPSSVSFTATLTATSNQTTSNTFSVQGAGNPNADVTAPTIPLGISTTALAATTATLTGIPASDPSPGAATWSGMAQYNVSVKQNGTPIGGSPFTVSSSTGFQPIWALTDVGTQTSTFSQSGADLTISTTAIDPNYPLTSALGGAGLQITGTSWTFTCRIDAFTSGNVYDNLRLEARPTLNTNEIYVALLCQPFAGGIGVTSEYRSAIGNNATKLMTTANSTAPVYLQMSRSADTYSFAWSLNAEGPYNSLGTQTQVMGNTLYLMAAGNASSAGTVSGVLKQVNVQTLAKWSLNLSGLTANTPYVATGTSQDGASNVSAVSAGYTFTTASSLSFPRAFTYRIGGSQQYGTAYRIWAGAFSQGNIINGDWVTWGQSFGPRDTVVQAIKAASTVPGGCKVWQYVICDTIQASASDFGSYASAHNWQLYLVGSSGTTAKNFFNSAWDQTNSALFVTPDANGNQLEAAAAVNFDAQFRTGGTVNASTHLDGFFHDNTLIHCRVDGDFNLSGSTKSAIVAPWPIDWCNGEATFYTKMISLNSAGLYLGNLNDPYNGNPTDTTQYGNVAGLLDGGMYEGPFGFIYSPGNNGETNPFTSFLQNYRFRLLVCNRGSTNYVTCGAQLNSSGALPITWDVSSGNPLTFGNNYQGMRYALTAVLLDNGGIHWSGSSNYNDNTDLFNFDEIGGNTAQYPALYLGARTGSPPTTAAVKGCWISTFANGISICNPAGNGSVTLTNTDLTAYNGGVLYRMRGPQNPSFNNAAQVTAAAPVVLADAGLNKHGDGIILMFAPQ